MLSAHDGLGPWLLIVQSDWSSPPALREDWHTGGACRYETRRKTIGRLSFEGCLPHHYNCRSSRR